MKRWMVLFGVVIALGLAMKTKHTGQDVAALQPVELLYVQQMWGEYVVTTDTGQQGRGRTAAQAIQNLKETTSGEIFLGTAEHLLLSVNSRDAVSRFARYLRPDCSVTLVLGEPEPAQAAAFLDTHHPGLTLNDYRAGAQDVPVLDATEGGLILNE